MSRLRSIVLVFALFALIAALLWPGIAAVGYRLGWWDLGFGMGTMTREWWPYLRYLSIGLGALLLLLSVSVQPRRMIGIVVGALALALPFAAQMQADRVTAAARSVPPIHDITTDRQDPPEFTDAIMSIREAEGSNPAHYVGKVRKGRDGSPDRLVADLQAESYPDIVPIVVSEKPADAYGQALRAVTSLGWAVVTDDPEAGLIEATDTTFWYGFKDDIIVRVRASDVGGSVIDMRSLSRFGGSDLGKNASRIRAFRDKVTG